MVAFWEGDRTVGTHSHGTWFDKYLPAPFDMSNTNRNLTQVKEGVSYGFSSAVGNHSGLNIRPFVDMSTQEPDT